MQNGIRQKIIFCGKYESTKKVEHIEIDLIPYTGRKKRPGKRAKKEKISEPKQKNLNDKNAKRYFNQLIKSNFTEDDYLVHLTYNKNNYPASEEDADREVRNYLRRVERYLKKNGLPELKYIQVTETGSKSGRLHHHLFISGNIRRDVLEDLWRRPKKAGQKKPESIGWVRAERINLENDMEDIAEYLLKDPKGKKRWKQSQNLIKPWVRTNDSRYSRSMIDRIALLPSDCESVKRFFGFKYPGYALRSCRPVWNDEIKRWSIYLTMRLKN